MPATVTGVTPMKKALLIAALAAAAWPSPLSAQARRHRVMVGPALNSVNPFDADVGKDLGPGLVVRGVPRNGFGPVVDLSLFTLDLKHAGETTPLGVLRLRALLGGVGYTIERGRLATTLALAAGHAFTKADTRQAQIDRERGRFESRAWPVVRTKVTLTWSAGRRVALISSIGTLFADPDVKLRFDAPPRSEAGTWRTHSLVWQVGVAYKLF